jgi:hypothetical protein
MDHITRDQAVLEQAAWEPGAYDLANRICQRRGIWVVMMARSPVEKDSSLAAARAVIRSAATEDKVREADEHSTGIRSLVLRAMIGGAIISSTTTGMVIHGSMASSP